MIAFQLDRMRALEYNFSYQPNAFPAWTLSFTHPSGHVEVEGFTIEGVIDLAQKEITMNREQYLNAIQSVLDQKGTGLTAVFGHDTGGVAVITVIDPAIPEIPLVSIEIDDTDLAEAIDAVHEALPLWGL